MSEETTDTVEETTEETNQENNTPAVSEDNLPEVSADETALNVKELCEHAEQLQPSGEEMVSNYLKFSVGDENIKVLPLGIKRIEKKNPSNVDWDNKREDEDKPMTTAIRLLNLSDGNFYINADAVLVSTLKDPAIRNARKGNDEVKEFFNVSCIGTTDSPKGTYKEFSVQPLV